MIKADGYLPAPPEVAESRIGLKCLTSINRIPNKCALAARKFGFAPCPGRAACGQTLKERTVKPRGCDLDRQFQ